MESVKKSIDKRALHKREYDNWVNERQMQTTEEKVYMSKALNASLVNTESNRTESGKQDTSSRSGNDAYAKNADIKLVYDEEPMAENAEQCHDIRPLPAKLTDNQITELSNQSLESENIWQQSQVLNEKSNEAKDFEKALQRTSDSIKTTRAKTIEHTTSLIAKNNEFKAQLREQGFAIVALKNELRKLKGNSVNTKFAKSSILRKPVLQPHRNQSVVRQLTAFKSKRPRISKPRFASQVDVNNDLSKPVTTYYFPNGKETACTKPYHMTALGSSRYSSNDMVHSHYLEEAKKQTHEIGKKSKISMMPSARSQSTSNDCNPKPRSSLRYQVYQGRLLESFQKDAKYEHVGKDTRSQGGKDDQDKQGKDLEISKSKTKSKDNDKGSRSKITHHEGTSLQHNKDQRLKNSTTKQSQEVQGSKIQDLTSGIRRPHIRGDWWVFLASTKKDKGKEKVNQNETNGVEARSSTTDKGKENVSQDETGGAEARTSTVDSDYDSEYDSDNSIDYLSPDEEELIELRNRMKANKEAKTKAKGNLVTEMNEPNDDNSMSADNVRGCKNDATVEQFKERLTYYALANGFSLWCERSSRKKVVAKYGQRPPRLSVLEKGKQRKHSRVPESYVPAWSETDLYFVAYHHFLKPVPGMNLWLDQSMYSTILPSKPKKMPGTVRDVSEQGGNGSAQQGSAGAGRSKKYGVGGSKQGRVVAGGQKEVRLQKRVGTYGFARWFGLQDGPVQTQDDPVQTQDDPVQTQADLVQTQDQDQVEQAQEQAEIDLTQVEQTQEQNQDQVQTQEQPEQVTFGRPSARILQRKLAKQGSSQYTAFGVE
ncbi:hypothetical protein Tco_0952531 [Tanacetum coccineum]|uniref:Uncharacterized protein n=1 Tax=Tanacetum coccineum TaxID=301880 RepID=A0ABQ5E047_9ASTR